MALTQLLFELGPLYEGGGRLKRSYPAYSYLTGIRGSFPSVPKLPPDILSESPMSSQMHWQGEDASDVARSLSGTVLSFP
jgi:hypothetical protein